MKTATFFIKDYCVSYAAGVARARVCKDAAGCECAGERARIEAENMILPFFSLGNFTDNLMQRHTKATRTKQDSTGKQGALSKQHDVVFRGSELLTQ